MLYVTMSFAIASSAAYSEIPQNFSNSVGGGGVEFFFLSHSEMSYEVNKKCIIYAAIKNVNVSQ